ncbi:MAG: hypothetical protein O3C40_35145 [Planctomycetota bacterium]|nr:hypothetical protein [Planctomycetota bacterium]
MNKSNKTTLSHSRPQFRLRSLLLFTTGLCAVSAVLAALNIQPLQLLAAVMFFSLGVAVVVLQFELLLIAAGTRTRQRHGAKHRRK